MLGTEVVRTLTARASTFSERLSGFYVPVQSEEPDRAASDRLSAWRERCTGGDGPQFDQRLAVEGVDAEYVTQLLGKVRLREETEPASWTETLRWMLAAMTSGAGVGSRDRGCASAPGAKEHPHPLPFEELFLPLLRQARALRDQSHSPASRNLNETAHGGLDRLLLSRLAGLCAPALYEGFSLHRFATEPHALFHGLPLAFDPGPKDLYNGYLAKLRGGQLEALFTERPVLARLSACITELWISSTDLFLSRLAEDLVSIGRTFLDGRPPGEVVRIEGGLSDPHAGGQSVLRVTFACGLEVGYKPRDLGLDVAWRDFLGWLDTHRAPRSAQSPGLLPRDRYGWVEWISRQPCADRPSAERFFERAGSTLCLLHFLRGTDFHFENVIAAGDTPVPVDLETLLEPVPTDGDTDGRLDTSARRATRWLRESVLSTGYLPRWMVMPGGHLIAVGGLYAQEHRLSMHRMFTNPNTDAMAFEVVTASAPDASNAATLSGQTLAAGQFAAEVSRGYAAMYRFLARKRAMLLSSNGPLCGFRGCSVRAVLRPTVLYALLIRKSVRTRNLRDGADWSLEFEFLARRCDFGNCEDDYQIVRDEIRALERLDIPYLTARTDSTSLWLSDGTEIEAFFDEPAFAQVVDQAKRMSEERLAEALETIGQALHAECCSPVGGSAPAGTDRPSPPSEITRERAVQVARSLAARIEEKAIRGIDGLSWIGGVPLAGETMVQLDAVGHDLYAGRTGIALLFSALHKLTACRTYRDLALAALEPSRQSVRDPGRRARLGRTIGIGGASGIGSLVYALTRSATMLGDPDLLDDAAAAADGLTEALIDADQTFDVIAGAAGAALGLIALYGQCRDEQLLERACACGRHLLRHRVDCGGPGFAWRSLGGQALTGISHGASGIALALCRIGEATGENAFVDAARDALAFEDALFSEAAGNWPDLRDGPAGGSGFACQWCHGAPGIGLARLGLLGAFQRPSDIAAIEAALAATLAAPDLPVDHLCCGNFGRIEVLFSCGRRLGRADLVHDALRRADALVGSAEGCGDFRWPLGNGRFSPGFFCGRAGVAYQLLRLSHPDALPSILSWD